MRENVLRLVVAFVCLGSVACNKGMSFEYFHPQAPHVSADHKLKELVGNNDLDILWVIDNSGSMGTHQQTVINNLNQFTNGLSQNNVLHWKSGIISTSQGEAPYIGFVSGDEVDYTMANAATRFQAAVGRLGTGGDSTEKTFDPVIDVLTKYPTFLRSTAALAIILISDAPEQSSTTTAQFVQTLTQMKGSDVHKILFYGFLNPQDWCTPTDDAFTWQGSKFQDLLTMVSGSAYPLCDPQFGSKLATLGSNLATTATHPRIMLEQKPVISSIHVLHNGQDVPGGSQGDWYYDPSLNAIVFTDLSFAPGNNESVTLTFDVDLGVE